MRCDRCGRENPDHLTFCEDCGFALAKAPRKDGGAAASARPIAAGQGAGTTQRPQAPPLQLNPPIEPPAAHGPRPQAPPLLRPESAGSTPMRAEGWVTCGVCHTRNQLGHRFCVACGSGLQGDVSMHVVSGPMAQAAPTDGQASGASAQASPQTAPQPADPAPRPLSAASQPTAPPGEPASGTAPTAAFAAFPSPGQGAPVPVQGFAPAAIPQPLSPPLQPLPAAPIGAPLPLPTPQPSPAVVTAPRPSADPVAGGSPPAPAHPVEVSPPPAPAPFRPPTVPDGLAAAAVARRESDPSFSQPAAVCPRCQSRSEGGSQYCRVCGFALGGRQPGFAPQAPGHHPLPLEDRAGEAGGEPAPAESRRPGELSPLQSTVILDRPVHAAPRPAGRLVLLGKDGSDGAAFPLHGEAMDVGSREGAVQIPDDPYLSPRHARLTREGGVWHVVDLESVNGVYIKLRGQRPVGDGDLILLGQQVLRFEVVSDAEHGLRPATQHGAALFGTPQSARYARLCQRTVEGVTRDIFHLHRTETSLGRETADIVFSDDPFLSRRHAVIRLLPSPAVPGGPTAAAVPAAPHRFTIEDHGSSNGTFVAIRGREPLTNGDVLRMGLHVFRVELQDEGRSGQP